VWRYIERNNVMCLVISLEFIGVVALVAVKDQKPIFTLYTSRYMQIEMPNLIYAFLIRSLAIVGCYNTPGGWKVTFLIPISKVILRS